MIHFVVVHGYRKLGYLPKTTFAFVSANKIAAHSSIFTNMPHNKTVIDAGANLVITKNTAYQTNHGDNEHDDLVAASIALDLILDENANEVDKVANGDKDIIESAGYDATAEKTVTPKAPYSVEPGPVAGSVALSYVKGDKDVAVVWLSYKGKTPPQNFDDYKPCIGTSRDDFEKGGFISGDWMCFVASPITIKSNGEFVWTPAMIVLIP